MVEVNEARRGDSARAAIELIEKAMEGVTPGRWGQFHPSYAPEAEGTPFSTWDTSHDLSAIKDGKKFGRIATFKHSSDAAYVDACNPVAMSAILAEARKAEAMEREIAELKADLAELRAFAASFKLTCVESGFYKDCYLHINEPDAVSFRLGNGSQFSKFIAKLEDRRARTLLNGGSDAHD